MSSEGSVSSNGSRIRQFGLYRTIDSRTEDFLRSSRKKQIRQGCACAAISTAITVTVVISVILVYEYSINSGANTNKKSSLNPNWIALINDSDITSISSKFNKKINFDRTTLKLLPILLKALNKNRYLEKILEDYSSSPPYAGTDSTEATFTKNVFSDSKNWLKLPTTRHYSTDYKTSHLMPWKTPTQRLEYLTKIRKIRDYQRMLNYFDKMINDKVGIYQKREFEYTDSPLAAMTVPMTKIDKYRNIQRLRNVPSIMKVDNPVDNDGVVCNCPKKLGMLLSKLIGALQDLIPHIIGNNLNLNIPCKNKTKSKQLITAPEVPPTKQRINDIFSTVTHGTQKTTNNRPKVTLTSRKCCTKSTTSTSSTSKTTSTASKTTRTSTKTTSTGTKTTSTGTKTTGTGTKTTSAGTKTINAVTKTASANTKTTSTATKTTNSTTAQTTTSSTIVATKKSTTPSQNKIKNYISENSKIPTPSKKPLYIPDYQILVETTTDYDLFTKPTTEPPNTQTTKSVEVKRRTTEAIVPVKFITESSTEKWLKPYNVESFYPKVNMPLYKEEDYDDYFNNKPVKPANGFENIDVHSIESLKTKTTFSIEDLGLGKGDKKINIKGTIDDVKPLNYHTVTMQDDVDLTSMRKLADMLYLPPDKTARVWKYNIEPRLPTPSPTKIEYPVTQATTMVTNSIENPVDPTTNILVTNSIESTVDPITNIIVTNPVEPTTSVIFSSSRKSIQIADIAPELKNNHYKVTSKYQPNSLMRNEQQNIVENIGDDEFLEEYMPLTENTRTPYKYNNFTKYIYPTTETTQQEPWELMKKEEKIVNNISSKSMLPALRPIYLEIQRNNEWKPEEHGDYDNYNFNNNIFDLPNIN